MNNMHYKNLIKKQIEGFGLDSPFYSDQELYSYDFDAIFLTHWIIAGHTSQLQLGSYFSVDIGKESILLSMDKSGDIYAHFNVCRHRGCSLSSNNLTVSNKIVCPYHSWQYSLDGELKHATGMPESFDIKKHGLKKCGVKVFEGLIFINMKDKVDTDFEQALKDAKYFLEPLCISQTKIAASKKWDVNANWKLLVENFEECYHCAAIHPEYSSVMAHAKAESTGSKKMLEKWEADRKLWDLELKKKGLPFGWINPNKKNLHFCARVPFKKGMLTQSLNGKLVSKLLGKLNSSDGGSTSFRLYPTSFMICCPDHLIIIKFYPVGPTKTLVVADWLVASNAIEGIDYNTKDLTALWAVTIEQDNTAVELTQSRVASIAYQAGPFSESEEYSSIFVSWYLSKLQEHIESIPLEN